MEIQLTVIVGRPRAKAGRGLNVFGVIALGGYTRTGAQQQRTTDQQDFEEV